jgi:diguanylate cyclase (GGDEF)-like protein
MLRRLLARPNVWTILYLDAAIIATLILMPTNEVSMDAFHVVFWLMIGEAFFLKRWGFWVRLAIALAACEILIIRAGNPDWRDLVEPFGLAGIAATVFVLHSSRDRARDALRRLATVDGLTGVLNRRAFQSRLDDAIALLDRYATPFALVYVDLDGFKNVNDDYGHDAGDAVLTEAARRLESSTRATDHVGRIGGDEFAILLSDADSPSDVENLARRVLAQLGAPFVSDDAAVRLSASAGLVLATPGKQETSERLLADADKAMYRVKRTQKGAYAFAEPEASS